VSDWSDVGNWTGEWDDPRYSWPNPATGQPDPNYIPPPPPPPPPSPATPPPAPAPAPPTPPPAAPPPTPPPPPGPTPTPEPTTAQLDANAQIKAYLNQYGLGELADWVWQQIVDGSTQAQIELQLYDPASVPGKVVDRLYPELKMQREASQTLGIVPMSISEAAGYRTTAVQLMQAAHLPAGFYDDPQDIARFSGRGTSLAELKDRIDEGVVAASQAPAETRQQLHSIYNVDLGGIAAYFLDPEKAQSVLQKQFAAATLSGTAVRSRFGGLSQAEAERYAALGVSPDQAAQGFGALVQNRELFGGLPGERGGLISRQQQLAAAFGGDEAAQAAIERKRRAREAIFGEGGGFAATQKGVAGLGSAAG
jgi:hypothetical protein